MIYLIDYLKKNKGWMSLLLLALLVVIVWVLIFSHNMDQKSASSTSTQLLDANEDLENRLPGITNAGGLVQKVKPVKVKSGDQILIKGWAADLTNHVPARTVEIIDNGKVLPLTIDVNLERKGLAGFLNNKSLLLSGWKVSLNAGNLGKGVHKLRFEAIFRDGRKVPLLFKDKQMSTVQVID